MALLASMMLAGGVGAANTRGVLFGSPGKDGGGYNTDGTLRHGVLENTPVTVGGKSGVVIRLENRSGSTLNKVKIAGGDITNDKAYNTLFPRPLNASLPPGASYAAVVPLSGTATCDPKNDTSFQCDFGNLPASGPSSAVELLVVIAAPSTSGPYPYWFTGSWNEGWSSTGSNADYNFAEDTLDVVDASCDNGTASWFLGNQRVNLDDGGTKCDNLDAVIASGKNGDKTLGDNGGFASVKIGDSQVGQCPTGFKCFGNTVDVSILGGNSVPGGVEWKVTWSGTKTIKGVIHYGDDYATDKTDFDVITFNKQSKCTTTKLTDCWTSTSTTSNPSSVTFTFVTDGNGKAGGWT